MPMRPISFHIMTKPRGAVCNLDCSYCYFLKKEQLYPGANFRMSEDVLESYTRQYILAQQANLVTFAWQGGEPTLMGIPFFEHALEFQNQYRQPGTEIENTLQTNGTLLDDAWCQFLHANNFLVGISLDGPEHLHNVYRKNKGGNPTFAQVMHGVELLKKHQVEFNILCTVNSANCSQPLEVYKFFRDEIGAEFIQFIPIVERDNKQGQQKGSKITNRSVPATAFGEFLIAIFDEWIRHDVGKIYVQMFDTALGKWIGAPGGLCVFEPTCGLGLAMEHNGDLFSCDHFVEPSFRLGNILKADLLEMVGSRTQFQFGQDKLTTLPKYCLQCEVRFACNGGCPKDRIRQTSDGENGLNYLCAGYKAFFKHIDPAMRIMATLLRTQRPAAEIMQSNLNLEPHAKHKYTAD